VILNLALKTKFIEIENFFGFFPMFTQVTIFLAPIAMKIVMKSGIKLPKKLITFI
jgi:hypothetical protein